MILSPVKVSYLILQDNETTKVPALGLGNDCHFFNEFTLLRLSVLMKCPLKKLSGCVGWKERKFVLSALPIKIFLSIYKVK